MTSSRRLLLTVAASLALGVAAKAATIPYTNTFDSATIGTTLPSEFTTSGPSNAWSIVNGPTGGDLELQNSYSATSTATTSTAAVDFSGSIGGALTQSFTTRVDFKIDTVTVTSANMTIGLAAMGMTSSFGGTTAGTAYYLADISIGDQGTPGNVGGIRLLELGATQTTIIALAQSNVVINTTDTYRLTLSGVYTSATNLNFTLTFENLTTPNPTSGVGSVTRTGSDSTPLTGTFFGLRSRIANTGVMDVNYDNFAVVPEPGSVALLGLGASLVGRRRRR